MLTVNPLITPHTILSKINQESAEHPKSKNITHSSFNYFFVRDTVEKTI